ncbi:MAG: prepilin-type N-terminal cleavage/methylation domain-containing protein [Maioricimonas sp. JB045]|uniref:prepilin-type N-terminal cleavage/methylation domain-containing protein n=1 Tax=Maioricimonas sp. JC845 TaxID=3232138 RepID=UPI00345A12A4
MRSSPLRPGIARRRGFTLFEVVLALTIFFGSIAVVAQIVDTGSRAANQARLQSDAVVRCESKMNEVVAGVIPPMSVSGSAFDDDPVWQWSLSVVEGPHIDLLELTVTVTHTRQNGLSDAEYTLTRYIRDPEIWVEAASSSESTVEGLESL